MKILTRDRDQHYLISLKERLEENGIPAMIQGEDTARMIIPAFLLEPTLWIYLDEQFEDALKLLDNPNHVVTTGVDLQAFHEARPSDNETGKATHRTLFDMALLIGLVMLLMFVAIKVLDAL